MSVPICWSCEEGDEVGYDGEENRFNNGAVDWTVFRLFVVDGYFGVHPMQT